MLDLNIICFKKSQTMYSLSQQSRQDLRKLITAKEFN